MKRIGTMIVWVLVIALGIGGCTGFRTVRGSGKAASEEREVSDFTGVELATFGKVYVELGDEETLRIEADDNLLRYFETRVRDGVLEIGGRSRVTMLPVEPVTFYVTLRQLDTIVLSGLGSIESREGVETSKLSVEILGGGNVELRDLSADELAVRISGLGDLYIEEGQVQEQEVVISGGGNYRARGLKSADGEVRVTGLGSATVRVQESLKVEISGGGSVRYVGSPKVEQDVSGLGHVERIEE
jgi:hypothetical protein